METLLFTAPTKAKLRVPVPDTLLRTAQQRFASARASVAKRAPKVPGGTSEPKLGGGGGSSIRSPEIEDRGGGSTIARGAPGAS
ncbi:hypothetical protein NL676_029067 [Syzygium grande]|nr:hypothetical protein NL676_029067 [Syzygium grande]